MNFKKCGISIFAMGIILLNISVSHAESLNYVISHTVNNNPQVLISGTERLQAGQDVIIARSPFFPSIDVEADGGRERNRNNNTLFQWRSLNRRQASITVTQNVFNGFGDYYRTKENKFRVTAAAYNVNNTAQNIAADVVTAYLNVLRERRLVHIARRNVRVHYETLTMIRKRGETGLGRKADVVQAEGRYALARSNLISEKNNLRDAIASYIQVVGLPPINLMMPRLSPHAVPATESEALSYAMLFNPSLHSAHANLVARNYQRLAAQAPFYPSLDIVLNSRRGKDLGGVNGLNDDDFAILRLRWNLYRGGSDLANVRKSAYEKQEAFERIRDTQREVGQSVRLAWNAYVANGENIPQLRTHKVKSQATVTAFRQQFEINKRTLFDLLNAENEHFAASRAYVNGQFDYVIAQYQLLNAMGKLLKIAHACLPSTAKRVHPSPLPHKSGKGDLSSHKRIWAIQMGTFTHQHNATAFVGHLRFLHYPAYVHEAIISDKKYFSVLIGPFYTCHAAKVELHRLDTRTHYRKGYLISANLDQAVVYK